MKSTISRSVFQSFRIFSYNVSRWGFRILPRYPEMTIAQCSTCHISWRYILCIAAILTTAREYENPEFQWGYWQDNCIAEYHVACFYGVAILIAVDLMICSQYNVRYISIDSNLPCLSPEWCQRYNYIGLIQFTATWYATSYSDASLFGCQLFKPISKASRSIEAITCPICPMSTV